MNQMGLGFDWQIKDLSRLYCDQQPGRRIQCQEIIHLSEMPVQAGANNAAATASLKQDEASVISVWQENNKFLPDYCNRQLPQSSSSPQGSSEFWFCSYKMVQQH